MSETLDTSERMDSGKMKNNGLNDGRVYVEESELDIEKNGDIEAMT